MSEQARQDTDLDTFKKTARQSEEAGVADESAAYDDSMTPTEGGKPAEDSEAHPS